MSILSTLSLNFVLKQALDTSHALLEEFLLSPTFDRNIEQAFGNRSNLEQVRIIIQNPSFLPTISIRPSAEIGYGRGAFSGNTHTIYLAQEFLSQNLRNVNTITEILLEEIGHAIDWQLNSTDTPGDEGEAFSALVRGIELDRATQQRIETEDDKITVTLDRQTIELEQASFGVNQAFDLIGLTQLRNDARFAGIDGSGVSVVIIDTGLDRTHPLLQPNYRTGIDFVNGGDNPIDNEGHGTHVAGTIGARDENIGVAPDVGLIGLQVFESNGYTNNPTVEAALQWVEENRQRYNIVAVNMSLGAGFYQSSNELAGDPRIDEIRRLEAAGVTVVSAAGNSYKNNEYQNVAAPAIYSTLAVGSVWEDGVNSGFQWGSGAIDYTTGSDRLVSHSQRLVAANSIFAPGALINSTTPGSRTEELGGTSMASPHVAGAVALMQEAALQFGGRLLLPSEVVEIMRSTAENVFDGDNEDDNVLNTNVNYPRLNIYNAISEIQRRFNNNAPPPPGTGGGDANGTISGAILVPTLDGTPIDPILGTIGFDGISTNIGDKDVDIYRFTVASPGRVTIEVGSYPSNQVDFDSILRLFDASGNQLALNDDIDNSNQFSRLSVDLNPGTYFVGLSGYDNSSYNPNVAGSGVSGATGNYSLQFSLTNPDPNGLISGAVAVNLGNALDPLIFPGNIGSDLGVPVGVSDVDLFKLVVPDNGRLFIDIDTPYMSGYVDSYLRIFDANGNALIASDDQISYDVTGAATEYPDLGLVFEDPFDRTVIDGQFDDGGNYFPGNYGHRTDSFVTGTVTRGEVYYIGVSDYFNQSYNPTNLNNRPASGEGGRYDLVVTFINNDLNGSIPQALTTIPLPVTNQRGRIGTDGNPQTGEIQDVGNKDVDFIKVRSQNANILEINVDSYTASSITSPVDSVAFLFNSAGRLLAANDDNDSYDPRLLYQIQANTDYYVAITGYGNDNFDPFALGSGSGGVTGEYLFNSNLLPFSQAVSLSDNIISAASVRNIGFDSSQFGTIGDDNGFVIGAADVDLYRFVPAISTQVDIGVNAYSEYSADTFLRIFDVNGNEIAFNDNGSNTTGSSFLQLAVTAGATYYIGINGASSQARNYNPINGAGIAAGSEGDYILRVNQSEYPADPAQYGASYADLIVNIGYNLEALRQHYRNFGRFEGRSADNFDELRYLASNTGLLATFGLDTAAATYHYIQYGYYEGRSLNTFDPSRYLASHRDIFNVYGYNLTEATRHYLTYGYQEGRDPYRFSPLRYIASYPDDLINTYGNNPQEASNHYLQYGYQEGRNPNLFPSDRYLASHTDLIRAYGYNLDAANYHYITYGAREGRVSNFDPQAYLNHNSDLIPFYANNLDGATYHYIQYGFNEGRTWV